MAPRIASSLGFLLHLFCLQRISSFQPSSHRIPRVKIILFNNGNERKGIWNGVQSLWEEVIEMSTYGPSERKMLKVRRQQKAEREARENQEDIIQDDSDSSVREFDDLSLDAFRSVANQISRPAEALDFDGYAMQELLLEKWGIPLDVDFQRQPSAVYCTVMPVAFGSRKCRHESELDYLMHLQGVVEILHQYDNLDLFVDFVQTTNKVPKVGTDSVPFRMQLDGKQLDQIL